MLLRGLLGAALRRSRVPAGGDAHVWLEGFELRRRAMGQFQIPIGLAFFMRSERHRRGGGFLSKPGRGDGVRARASSAWEELIARNPAVADLEPDAEALMVNRLSDPPEYVIAPIDQCYALVGLIKSRWEGISGGDALEGGGPRVLRRARGPVR